MGHSTLWLREEAPPAGPCWPGVAEGYRRRAPSLGDGEGLRRGLMRAAERLRPCLGKSRVPWSS